MSTPNSAAETPEPDTEVVADPAPGPDLAITETRVEVTLQRSVRFGPVIIGAVIVCVTVAVIASLMFPVVEDAQYMMGQVVGMSAIVGAAIGLFLGGTLTLILALVARRKRGRGVAIQADVR